MAHKLTDEQRGRLSDARELAIRLLVAAEREDLRDFEVAREEIKLLFTSIDLDMRAWRDLGEEL